MISFLTSSPTGPLDGSRVVDGLDEMNQFRENLKRYWKEDSRCLMIAAAPNEYERNDEMTSFFAEAVKKSGLSISGFDLWDHRVQDPEEAKLDPYDVIFLGGGHVPTQNAFFMELQLRAKIQSFQGIVIGISAGTMNAADVVYAQPELEGESVDPDYRRFLLGLNLTKTQILPHYQMTAQTWLDGKRLFENITYEDSKGRNFLALVDGSYLMCVDGEETVWGEAYSISNGQLSLAGREGEAHPFYND